MADNNMPVYYDWTPEQAIRELGRLKEIIFEELAKAMDTATYHKREDFASAVANVERWRVLLKIVSKAGLEGEFADYETAKKEAKG